MAAARSALPVEAKAGMVLVTQPDEVAAWWGASGYGAYWVEVQGLEAHLRAGLQGSWRWLSRVTWVVGTQRAVQLA